MKRTTFGIVLASLTLLTACSGGTDAEEPGAAAGDTSSESPAEESTPEETTEETTEAPSGGSTVLLGSVGTEEDPEAFVISLTTEDGQEVTELPAGDYTIQVTDTATIHNFHLVGGSVDESTSVPEVEDTVFEVTLEPGEYTFKCDPHPPMSGSFTVTS